MFHLIILDDEDMILEGLSNYIDWNNLGFHLVGTANTIAEAYALIESEPVHVLMSDLHLEDESGLDFIGQLHHSHPHIKTIILSGYGEFPYAQAAFRLDVFDFLTKPVEFHLLYETFQKLYKVLEAEEERQVQKPEPLYVSGLDQLIDQSNEEMTDVIEQIKAYIGENYQENITLQSLSEQFYLHPIYLSKLFKNKTGQNFIDYLTLVRYTVAKRLLEESKLKIYEISDLCGYKSSKYFSKIFKSMSGFTPKDYRKSLGIDEE